MKVNGLELSLLEWGVPGRPPLCFLHGGSAHAHWFDGVAPAFAEGHHVVSLDQRGHGESEWSPAGAYATPDFASDLLGVMDQLGWERMILVGHSMGGHNAMSFSAWHPERVQALVIVDSRPSMPAERLAMMHRRGHRGPRRHETLELALRSFRLLPKDTIADPALLEHMAREGVTERDGRFLYRFDPACNGARQPTDAWPLLPRITAPTLLVRGELSPILPREMAAEILALIPGARLEEIPGVYHHLVLDAPDSFTQVLARFLGSGFAI
jgi:pimeloyl-ACP methyl ester carboxylesterase